MRERLPSPVLYGIGNGASINHWRQFDRDTPSTESRRHLQHPIGRQRQIGSSRAEPIIEGKVNRVAPARCMPILFRSNDHPQTQGRPNNFEQHIR